MPNSSPQAHYTSVGEEEYRNYEIPPDVQLEACIKGADFQEQEYQGGYRVASTGFELPIIEALFLLSRGDNSVGTVRVASSPEQPSGMANVKVTARYLREDVRNQARVFLLCKGKCAKGVGIFTPSLYERSYYINNLNVPIDFEITVTLPEGTEDKPFKIPEFHSDAPGMTHAFNELPKVAFGEITMWSSNHAILLDFLRVERGTIQTSNASIRGHFESTRKIQLHTSNGAINVEVMLRGGGSDAALMATTSNGQVTANIRASSSTSEPGSFGVLVKTSNGAIDLDFKEAPECSTVNLEAVTSNGRATVHLPPTFDGKFVATTSSHSRATVENTVQNREGNYTTVKCREIHLQMEKPSVGRVLGRVGCTEDRKETSIGKAYVKTSNAPATIYLR